MHRRISAGGLTSRGSVKNSNERGDDGLCRRLALHPENSLQFCCCRATAKTGVARRRRAAGVGCYAGAITPRSSSPEEDHIMNLIQIASVTTLGLFLGMLLFLEVGHRIGLHHLA